MRGPAATGARRGVVVGGQQIAAAVEEVELGVYRVSLALCVIDVEDERLAGAHIEAEEVDVVTIVGPNETVYRHPREGVVPDIGVAAEAEL